MDSTGWWLWLTTVLATLCFLPAARADDGPTTDKVGTRIENLTFRPVSGHPFPLNDGKDRPATVVVFLSLECPVSNSYAQPLSDLARSYAGKGVRFVGVCVDEDLSDAQLARQVQDYRMGFPVAKDEGHAAADAFKARVTPEAFVLDHHFVLRYRGRINDGYAARLKKNQQVTRHDLKQALDEVLAGKSVSEPATRAIGCNIPRSRPTKPPTTTLTFYKDVLPILQNHCQTCHRPGEVGPFALLTYKQAVNWAADIKDYTQARKMPPWKPVEGPAFHHERKLADHDIATLAAWVDGGTPAGDPKDSPPLRRFPEGWQLGKPDLVLTMPEEFHLAASGNDLFRCFVLPTHLTEDTYVAAVELRPGNPRVVHHSLLFIDSRGQGRDLEKHEQSGKKDGTEKDFGPGYSSRMGIGFVPSGGLGGWAPGQMPRELPEGTGYYLPKGSDVIMQLHYHRDGRPEKDRSTLGLYFARKAVKRRFQGMVIPGRFVFIPRDNDHYIVEGSIWCRTDCTLYSVMPHMHMLGREVKVKITPPGGTGQTLIAINDWDYNWQETYFFKQPIAVKAGTRFDIEARYDNSDGNPNNPSHPPRTVFFGQQTTDEMCYGFLGAATDKPGRIRVDRRGPQEKKAN